MTCYESLVSIVIPTKNRKGIIVETIDSLRAQTYPYWEAVIVDDRSDDESIEMLTALAQDEPRIRPYRREGNQGGAPVCRNQGLHLSQGKYVIFLDSDDLLDSTCLADRVSVMEGPSQYDITVWRQRTMVAGEPDRQAPTLLEGYPVIMLFLLIEGLWGATSAIWRKSFLEKVGDWDERFTCGQELELHTRALSMRPNFAWIEKSDCRYRDDHRLDRIGAGYMSLNCIKSYRLLFRSVYQRFITLDFVGGKYRAHLALIYLRHCMNMMRMFAHLKVTDLSSIRAYWQDARQLSLVNDMEAYLGWKIIQTQKVRYLGGLFKRIVHGLLMINLRRAYIRRPEDRIGLCPILITPPE